jgi:hypothetical protein
MYLLIYDYLHLFQDGPIKFFASLKRVRLSNFLPLALERNLTRANEEENLGWILPIQATGVAAWRKRRRYPVTSD